MSVPGELEELQASNNKQTADRQDFYSQVLYVARSRGFKDGWAAYQYKEKFGVFPRNIEQVVKIPSPTTLNWIKSRAIAFAKAKAKAAA
jgi:hypothetical protein